MDRNGFERYQESTQESLASTKSFVKSILNRKSALVDPIITPRFLPTCTRQLLEDLGKLAKDQNVRIQTHLSECLPEVAWVKELEPWSQNYTDVYAQTGILTEKTILAHGIYLDDSEIDVIKKYQSGISHCANSNNSLRSGNMDAVRYHESHPGLKVGLGTDCSGGYSPSLINAMRFSIATSNTVALTKKPENRGHLMDYQGAIALVTRGSAKVCHLEDKVGGFDEGLQFDALRIRMKTTQNFDTELFGFETIQDMIHKFVFLGDDRNIVQVFVNGKCVKNIIPDVNNGTK